MNKKSFLITAALVFLFASPLQAEQQGQIYGWGDQNLLNGETLTNISRISAGDSQSCAQVGRFYRRVGG